MADQADGSKIPSPQAGLDWRQRLRDWARRGRQWGQQVWRHLSDWGRSVWEWFRKAWGWLRQTLWQRWLRPALVMFMTALPLLGLWLLIPAVVLLLSTRWQADAPVRELSIRAHGRATKKIPDPTDGLLMLEIAYPRKLFLEAPDEVAVPLAVWLLRATPTPQPTVTLGPSLTSTSLPTPTPSPVLTQTVTTSLTPMPTPSPTPIPTPVPPYMLAFTPSEELAFTDEDGNPAWPAIVLTPAPFPGTPAVVHIRPMLSPGTPLPSELQLDAYVHGPWGVVPTPIPMTIGVETAEESRWRHWLNLLAGIPALIIALTTALVGFGVQQWKELADEEQRRRRKEIEAALRKVGEISELLETDPSEAARRFLGFSRRAYYPWTDPRVHDRLREVWEENAPPELQTFVELVQANRG